jgi:hypothetical protein
MTWHVDDILYDPTPQIEIVFTVENTSDCKTMWKTKKRKLLSSSDTADGNEEYETKWVETEPNSVLFIQAGGPEHCVTSLNYGKRIIIKCAYAATNSIHRTDDANSNQFQSLAGNIINKKTKTKHRRTKK